METELQTESNQLIVQAKSLVINSTDSYSLAGELWNAARSLREKIAEAWNPVIKKAHETHKQAIASRDKDDKPLEDVQRTLKASMIRWDQEQERIRKAEEARLQAEQQKREEEERLALASALEEAGQTEAAQSIIEQPIMPAPVVLENTTPKVDNFRARTVWKFRITDQAKIPREYLVPDMTKIGGVVRSMKEATNIPGVQPYEEKV